MTSRPIVLWTALALAVAPGCGADDGAAFSSDWTGGGAWQDSGAGRDDDGAEPGNSADGGASDAALEPEEEPELKLAPPASNRRFVYIASRSTNTVARVDSVTLAVQPIRVGREPTEVRTTPSANSALVLNSGDDTVSLIRSFATGDEVETFDVLPACNRLELSASGTWAVAWYDNRAARAGDRIGSLQEIALLDVEAGEVRILSVGFSVRDLRFDAAEDRLFVVTDSGVNVVDLAALTGDAAVPTVGIGDAPGAGSADREVYVATERRIALVRSTASPELRVVSLETGEIARVALPSPATDLDVLDDGRTVVTALRGSGQVAVLDIAEPVEGSRDYVLLDVENAVPGVITPLPSDRALAWTSVGDERRLALLDLAAVVEERGYELRKPVAGIAVPPSEGPVVVLHADGIGAVVPGAPLEQVIDASSAVSLLDLETGYGKLVLLDDTPEDLVFGPDGDVVFLMLADAARGVRSVERLDLRTFARQTFALDAEPEAIGVVPDSNRVWVSQVSTLGRLTFIDIDDGDMHVISGYQLNAYIE
jgi:DNA-binding beta-propeller fold protein YncE